MTFKELALPMIARGVPVDVVHPLGKACFRTGHRGTLDPKRVEEWNTENPAYNVACVGTPESVVILDCDSPGLPSRIERETGHKLPATFTVKSAGKGCAHLYFRQTDASRRLGNKRGADGQTKLFDLQSDGQYVVGPNSKLKKDDGTISTYELYRDAPIADFPDWLEPWILKYPDKRSRGSKAGDETAAEMVIDRYLENLNPEDMFGIPNLVFGDVHNTLKTIGAYLIDEDRDWDDITELLERLGKEYGHRQPAKKDTEYLVQWFINKGCAPMNLEPKSLSYLKFVYSTEKHLIGYPTQEAYDLGVAALLREERAAAAKDWRSIFHTKAFLQNAPPIRFAIEGWLQEEGITMLGGLPGHGKTLVALAMVRSLLEGSPLFGLFNVPRPSDRVIYLIPESGPSPWAARLRNFRVMDYNDDRLFTQTFAVQSEDPITLTHPLIKEACKGADVFLDTAVRFMEGDENAAAEQKVFAKNLFALLKAGARTVTGLHHSPKGTERLDYMSLENMLRGSGDIGAMLSACWGLRQIDPEKNRIFVENVKARDFAPCKPFIIEGRPHIDQTGYFHLNDSPGTAGTLNENRPRRGNERCSGRPQGAEKDSKMARIRVLHAEGLSTRDIATAVEVSQKTVSRWLVEDGEKQNEGEAKTPS